MDGKGVTGFPWRISLAFLLVALCVPPLAGLAEGFQDTLPGYEITLGGEGAEAYCIKVSDPRGGETLTYMDRPAAKFLNTVTLTGSCTLELVCQAEPEYGIRAVCP